MRCLPAAHSGDAPIILETVDTGGQWISESPRCPVCGFRTAAIVTDDDEARDITDWFIVSRRESTWAQWETEDP